MLSSSSRFTCVDIVYGAPFFQTFAYHPAIPTSTSKLQASLDELHRNQTRRERTRERLLVRVVVDGGPNFALLRPARNYLWGNDVPRRPKADSKETSRGYFESERTTSKTTSVIPTITWCPSLVWRCFSPTSLTATGFARVLGVFERGHDRDVMVQGIMPPSEDVRERVDGSNKEVSVTLFAEAFLLIFTWQTRTWSSLILWCAWETRIVINKRELLFWHNRHHEHVYHFYKQTRVDDTEDDLRDEKLLWAW